MNKSLKRSAQMAVHSKGNSSSNTTVEVCVTASERSSKYCIEQSFFLLFENISYSTRPSLFDREKKMLLRNVCGDFRPSELTAIIGASGAGKTTLLDILAGFTTSSVSGSVTINGIPRNLVNFRKSSAYIMQYDHMQSLFTVDEAMNVAADLKLNFEFKERSQRVDQILKVMSLIDCRNTRIEDLSGGQKKRVAIALELINDPPIMFLDEPTTGLDSVTAKQCLKFLKQLAVEGRTIVCTIHQPSALFFDMIDHLYVMADGQCVYAGGTQNLVPYLNALGFCCPTHYNPADFVIEICNGDYGDHLNRLVESAENGKSDTWRKKMNLSANRYEDVDIATSRKSLQRIPMKLSTLETECNKHGMLYATGFWRQLIVLLRRNAIKLSRDKVWTFTRISMHVLIALIVGAIYFNIGQDATYVRDNFNLLFFSLMFLMFSSFSAAIVTLPLELPILVREHFNCWYKLRSFYLANKLAEFPIQLIATCTYTLTVYYMSDQILETKRMILYVLMCLIVTMVAQAMGLLVGASLTVQNGMIFGPLAIMPFTVFSGFFIRLNDAHPYLRWLFHMSFLKYGFEGTMTAIYGYDRPKMHCSDIYCHFATPEQLLKAVNMKQVNYWFSISVLVALYLFIDLSAYLVLKVRLKMRHQIQMRI